MAITVARPLDTMTSPMMILAAAVDSEMLTIAERGVHASELGSRLPAPFLQRNFLRGKSSTEGMANTVRTACDICFKPLNLLSNSWPAGGALRRDFLRH